MSHIFLQPATPISGILLQNPKHKKRRIIIDKMISFEVFERNILTTSKEGLKRILGYSRRVERKLLNAIKKFRRDIIS